MRISDWSSDVCSSDLIVFFPSSAILASMSRWPSVFLARGLWCYADSLEGSMASYSRVDGPKELVVVRGPPPFSVWPEQEKNRVIERMIARSEEHTSELQSLMRISYAVFCLKKKH